MPLKHSELLSQSDLCYLLIYETGSIACTQEIKSNLYVELAKNGKWIFGEKVREKQVIISSAT